MTIQSATNDATDAMDAMDATDATDIGWLAEQACLLEATAAKVGNVHAAASFDDMTWADFAISAQAIRPVMARAVTQPLGMTIRDAVHATRQAVGVNTNLGLILLLAPMCAVPLGEPLRAGVQRVITNTTVDDARLMYEAIRLASPAGLGEVDEASVHHEPTITLLHAMKLAAERDAIAEQYACNFADLFDQVAAPLAQRLQNEQFIDDAIQGVHLTCIARGDSHIARKHGLDIATRAANRAQKTLNQWDKNRDREAVASSFDRWLRDHRPALNPGTSADLVGAAIFVALRERLLKPPYRWRNSLRFDACES